MGKTREQVMKLVAEHWPDLVKQCVHCCNQRKQLQELVRSLGSGAFDSACQAPGIDNIEIQCSRCNHLGFKLTEKGQALAELFGIGVPVEEQEQEVPY